MKRMDWIISIVAGVVLGILGLLAFPKLLYTNTSHAQAENKGVSSSYYYVEPTIQLKEIKLVTTSKTDITANNINVSGVDIWQGVHPLYLIGVHYTDSNQDYTERRFIFVVRGSTGDPWIMADTPVKDPNSVSDNTDLTNRMIWFAFDVDKTILESDKRIDPSWFTRIATSMIEIGITDQSQFNIAGPGGLPANASPLTPLYEIGDVLIFDQ